MLGLTASNPLLRLTLAVYALVFTAASQSAELRAVEVSGTSVEIAGSDVIARIDHFELVKPKRLVVDLYGIDSGRVPPPVALSGGFARLRAGSYADRIRFVFDVAGANMPRYEIKQQGRRVVVAWHGPPVPRETADVSARPASSRPRITAIDIRDPEDPRSAADAEPGRAQVRVSLEPSVGAGDVRQFVLKAPNRLVVDLPGVRPGQHGRNFALGHGFDRLRIGSTPQRTRLVFERERGSLPVHDVVVDPGSGQLVIAWGTPGTMAQPVAARPAARTVPVAPRPGAAGARRSDTTTTRSSDRDAREYVGSRKTFVYDNADVKAVLRDISSAGNRQIVIADEVSGRLTMRLVNVPWDQALDMVLKVAGLRSLEQGELLRIFPGQPPEGATRSTDDAEFLPDSVAPDTR